MSSGADAITTLGELLPRRCTHHPDRLAVKFGAREVSFAQLDRRSNQVANALLTESLGPQARVGLLDQNSDTFFEILFGVSKARLVLVTVNFRLAPPEIQYILDDSDTEVLFVGADCLPLLEGLDLARLKKVIILDGADDGEFVTWCGVNPDTPPAELVSPGDIAVQMYTSGTTGNPKGVTLSHAAMVNAAVAGLSVWPFLYNNGAAVLGTMPLFHIAAANLCIAALYAGARAEILRTATPQELAEVIPGHGITLVPLPATVIHAMLRLPDIRARDFSALEVMLVAGSGIAVALLREATEVFDCGFALSYGSTETCGGVTYLMPAECTADADERLASAGRVLAGSEVKICDSEGNELEAGQTGEVVCRTDRLMTEYWHRPQATADAIRDGWFFSGDAGYMDAEGYLFIVDRIKDMVLTGGENVYPTEVEQVIHTHPEVEDVAVIGVPDDQWGESLLAFVIIKQGQQATGSEIESFLRGRLAGYKIPRQYEFVASFPRNATGKILKRTLRAPYWHDRDRRVG